MAVHTLPPDSGLGLEPEHAQREAECSCAWVVAAAGQAKVLEHFIAKTDWACSEGVHASTIISQLEIAFAAYIAGNGDTPGAYVVTFYVHSVSYESAAHGGQHVQVHFDDVRYRPVTENEMRQWREQPDEFMLHANRLEFSAN